MTLDRIYRSQNYSVISMRLSKFLLSATFLSSAIVLGHSQSVQAMQLPFYSPSPQLIEINGSVGERVVSILSTEFNRFDPRLMVDSQIALSNQDAESRFSFDSRDPLAKEGPQASEQNPPEGSDALNANTLSDPDETLGGVYIPNVVTGSKNEGFMVDPDTRFW